ncbi:MAG: hypothetical protein A3C43_01875 [Candidatus Schekmanbacteria bacterium RIFCSPHIGHO2_02_FULL_38_11]|uniref:Uncharacterized protein n=1 Tax=Candidatus Schekmanbacteria bacterium RIFCSPLOWO2_12_FULL_38_15 TaxID=1817883 RepID=A0A1F7SHP8_9BACT|nr:MAG: hypothetical protein A3H37_03750 [Candidatus Schekmanbacteria bacterium RIFCSPLOWO2_02_FULL_38_14]OGL53312.1 MAG: hypothetical protein A3G31_07315 [Candidatus Schekmanbacteria bacterium RIFCSPLOWO2_12_FULL_38_15]OGL54803.1 MAG: hypothetical protein A3C43_01875 [Candidatus Schekmanbacteria bacterium RIFCSPHIGHO2_02_FULL_38_11]
MKELCKRHGKDYKGEKVGSYAGIYSFKLDEKDFEFFKNMADTYFKVYSGIIDRRKNEKFGQKEIDHKLKTHGLWAEWTMIEDEGTLFGIRKGIPPLATLYDTKVLR